MYAVFFLCKPDRIKAQANYCLLFCWVFVASCSQLSVKRPAEFDSPLWLAHEQRLQALENWQVLGRFAAQGEEESWNGHFQWQNRGKTYRLLIAAPLSGGSVVLEGDSRQAVLRMEDNSQYTEKSANDLLYRYTGLKLPVDQLKYWLRGLPAPRQAVKQASLDNQGKLLKLQQAGWAIEFKRYHQNGALSLPNKLFLANHEFDVRLVVQQWRTGL